jgi:hypothetical protein
MSDFCVHAILRFTGKGRPRQLRTLINALGTKVTWIHLQTLLEHLILDQKGAEVDLSLLHVVLFLHICRDLS